MEQQRKCQQASVEYAEQQCLVGWLQVRDKPEKCAAMANATTNMLIMPHKRKNNTNNNTNNNIGM